MKYFLLFGIEYKKYKSPANFEIFIDGHFIDQFELQRNHGTSTNFLASMEKKWFNETSNQHKFESDKEAQYWSQTEVPNLYKLYKIDDKQLNKSLEINVKNSNSNFTNGFMNKSSLIKLRCIALFPTNMVKNRGEKLFKTIVKFREGYRKCCIRRGNWFSQKNKDIWPCVDSFILHRVNHTTEKVGPGSHDWWIGGSFSAKIPIKTKHKVKYLKSCEAQSVGFPVTERPISYITASYTPLLNIYDENQ